MSNPAPGAIFPSESEVRNLFVWSLVPIPFGVLSTGLRLWVQLRLNGRRLAFDDYLGVAATIFSVANCITAITLTQEIPKSSSTHVVPVADPSIKAYLKTSYAMNQLLPAALCLTKLSVLALYHRALPSMVMRRVVIGSAVLVIAYTISIHCIFLLLCQPLRKIFDNSIEGTCIDGCQSSMYQMIFNMILDIWIFVIPLPVICSLRISRGEKIRLGLLFSIGLAYVTPQWVHLCSQSVTLKANRMRSSSTCSLAITRAVWVTASCHGNMAASGNSVATFIISIWEPFGAIFCANLPLIYKPFASACRRLFVGSSTDPSTPGGSPHSWYYVQKKMQLRRKRREAGLTVSTEENTESTINMDLLDTGRLLWTRAKDAEDGSRGEGGQSSGDRT